MKGNTMNNPRILIVEDDAILAAHLEETLPRLGYDVAGLAATGESAVKHAFDERPDAILMDIRLRDDMTGIEAAEEIRKSDDIPVIYLTAYTDERLLQKAKVTDAYAYLAKPVRERELRASLEMALYKHSSESRVRHLNLVLRAVRDINQLITHEHDTTSLLEGACGILVRTRGYRLVWFGTRREDDGRIVPVAAAGNETDYLDGITISTDCGEHSKGPTARAYLGRQPVVFRDLAANPDYEPWRAKAIAHGFVSSAAIPMLHADRLAGVMSVYADADDPTVFDDEEVNLLQEVANDIAFAIRSIEDERARLASERELAREKERLAVTLKCIGDGVITTDTSGNVVMMNKAAERLTGWKQAEAAGKPSESVFSIISDSTRTAYPDPVKKAIHTRDIVTLDFHALLVARDGTEYSIADSCSPILDDAGHITGAVIVFSDVTEKRKLMESAQRTQKLESLGILAGGIAHDFNNLLGGIYGNMEMARMSSKDPSVNGFLDAMLSTLERARGLTNQLLTFSKGGSPNRRTDKLFPLVHEAVEFALSGSNVAYAFEVPDDLWLCDFDTAQVAQVFDNIALNAVQAMPAGGTVKVEAANVELPHGGHTTLPEGRYVSVTVTDDGQGIPFEVLPRIFDPFFTTKQDGNGLGLAIAYSTVKKHGGTIDVKSEPGKGCSFTVLLPASAKTSPSARYMQGFISKGSGRVLIMDDDLALRNTYSVMLANLGYSTRCAGDGNEAIRIFTEETAAKRPFSAVVLDLTVHGGMGGREAAAEIRKIDSRVPIIVSSGYSEDEVFADPAKFGFSGSIRKPFTLSELSRCLSSSACSKTGDPSKK